MATTLTAQNILDWNGYTTDQCSVIITENLIDLSITDMNSDTGLSVSKMTGVAGAKTVSLTDPQLKAVMAGTVLQINSKLYHGKSGSLGAASASLMQEDPQNRLYYRKYKQAIRTLTGKSFDAV